jgi:hypothetical protein
MSRSIYKKVLELEKRRQQLVAELFSIAEMVQGSFCLIHVRCGKPHCRCNQGELHPHYRMSMRRNDKQVSRAVPKEEHVWIARATENYQKYRQIRKMLNALEEKIKSLLGVHEEKLVEKSSKGKSYLDFKMNGFETKFGKASEKARKTDKEK